MNIAIDYGNTQIKVGIFEKSNLITTHTFAKEKDFIHFLGTTRFDHAIISAVVCSTSVWSSSLQVHGKTIYVTHQTSLPIHIHYNTPDTLGTDRIAIACGVVELAPDRNCLAIDMGTCITFDFIDAQATYLGGAISPGMRMRYGAMYGFTSKLPLLQPESTFDLVASSTEACIQSGVMNGLLAEIEGIIDRYRKKFPNIKIFLCGGDSLFFEKKIKHSMSITPNLVLSGLNRILRYNIDL